MTRYVLITGAGSGLGRALAQHYAQHDSVVCCADIAIDRAAETVAMLPGTGHFAEPVDIASDESFATLRQQVLQKVPHLDVLINNAGVASGGGLLSASMDQWRWMLDINLLGVVRGCRTFVPDFVARKRGQVINIASFAGLAGAPNIMTYGVAKAGVVTLSEQLRAEVHHDGVRVSVACPSFFKTNLLANFREDGDTGMRRAAQRFMESSKDTAAVVAQRIHDAAERGEFMILPTTGELARWRLKRWFPEAYFKKLLAMIAEREAAAATRKEREA